MPRVEMTAEQRAQVEAAQRESRNVRHWKRYQAVLLRGEGTPVTVVAQTLGCSAASVTNWTTAWRERGVAGIREGVHPGAARRLDAAGETELVALVQSDPQAGGDAGNRGNAAVLPTGVTNRGARGRPRTAPP